MVSLQCIVPPDNALYRLGPGCPNMLFEHRVDPQTRLLGPGDGTVVRLHSVRFDEGSLAIAGFLAFTRP